MPCATRTRTHNERSTEPAHNVDARMRLSPLLTERSLTASARRQQYHSSQLSPLCTSQAEEAHLGRELQAAASPCGGLLGCDLFPILRLTMVQKSSITRVRCPRLRHRRILILTVRQFSTGLPHSPQSSSLVISYIYLILAMSTLLILISFVTLLLPPCAGSHLDWRQCTPIATGESPLM